MSTEYTAHQLSQLREDRMIAAAVRQNLSPVDYDEIERQAMSGKYRKPYRKKSRPEIGTAPVLSVAS